MGLDYHTAKWMLGTVQLSGADVLTVGRQNWWLSRRESRLIGWPDAPQYGPTNYSDAWWRHVGARVKTVDISTMESPDVVMDLSVAGSVDSSQLARRFDVVVDLGTAEHVADQSAYWKNLYDALRPNGSLVGMLPANGLCGHGLYQFSPEFFWSLGGFCVIGIFTVRYGPVVRFNPFRLDGRFQSSSRWPSYVAFHLARDASPFSMPVQFGGATTPTTPPNTSMLSRVLVEMPLIRAIERIARGI